MLFFYIPSFSISFIEICINSRILSTFQGLEKVLDFIYGQNIKLNPENLENITQAAAYMQVPALMTRICEYMRSSLEDLDDEKQSDFLSDLTGVPRNISFALKNKGGRNTRVEKSKKLEKISFYQRLLKKLGLEHLTTKLNDMNKLELELYMHAKELNKNMLDQWEKETQD